MRRPGRIGRRGATLIEAMIAMAVLGIGATGVVSLLGTVATTSRRMSFQNRSLAIAAEFVAQVRDARCDVPPDGPGIDWAALTGVQADPAFRAVLHEAPLPGSAVQLVGGLAGTPLAPVTGGAVPEILVSFNVTPENAAPEGPPALDIELIVREVTGDAARDDAAVTRGYWIRRFPVKKVCNLRLDDQGRGEYD